MLVTIHPTLGRLKASWTGGLAELLVANQKLTYSFLFLSFNIFMSFELSHLSLIGLDPCNVIHSI